MRPPKLSRGWGPWRENYYSICSAHHIFVHDCPRCEVGTWYNAWLGKVSNLAYRISPHLWRLWVNRK